VIDHTLYWGAAGSKEEALYLSAVLNSPRITELVRPLMSYGKDEHHIDMAFWRLPIPLYDPIDEQHLQLVELGWQAETEVAALDIDESRHFPSLRRQIRRHLADSPIGQQIDDVVDSLLARAGATSDS
jgi:hypothetical protein